MAGATPPPRSTFRWPELESSLRSSLFRWSAVVSSWNWSAAWLRRWPRRLLRAPIVDDLVYSVATAVESVALVSIIGFFFVFYGCNL